MPAPEISELTAQQVLSIVQRVEREHDERKLSDDNLREIFAEAKANGYDTAVIKIIVKRRRADPDKLRESDLILETYLAAIESASPGSARSRAQVVGGADKQPAEQLVPAD